jgi:hypothetical protein
MPTKTFWVLASGVSPTGAGTATPPGWFSVLQEDGAAPAPANTWYGWGAAQIPITTPYYRGRIGATEITDLNALASSWNASTSGPTPGTGTAGLAAGDCFITPNWLNGTFAAGTWTFNWNMRCSNVGMVGHVNMRVWASVNPSGAGARELTTGNMPGATITLSNSADSNSSISWSPGAITLNKEYLFFQLEWQETVQGTQNTCNALFRAGTASITTPNFYEVGAAPTAFQPTGFQANAFQATIALRANNYSLGALQIGIPSLSITRQLTASNYWLGSPVFAAPAVKINFQLAAPSYSLGSPVFANPALSTRSQVVAGDYSLGSPVFAQPALTFKWVFAKPPDYSLGSPVFAKPALIGVTISLHANNYYLGSPSFGAPAVRFIQKFIGPTYSLGGPSFAKPALSETHKLFANNYSLASPVYGTPRASQTNQLSATDFFVGSPTFDPPVIVGLDTTLRANDFAISRLWFGYPRLEVSQPTPPWPPSYLTQVESATDLLEGFVNAVLRSVPDTSTNEAQTLLQLGNAIRADASNLIRGDTLGTTLQEFMAAADTVGATYGGIEEARKYLMSFSGSPQVFTQIVMRAALVMTLGLESKIISRMQFGTQAEAQTMVAAVQAMFDDARAIGIDTIDALVYEDIILLAGSITNHLATTALKLPRYLTYRTRLPMPSLYLANRIYGDASRFEEIEAENGVINPAFCPMTLRVLSEAEISPLPGGPYRMS